MDVEILLDTKESNPDNLAQIKNRFQEWYREGAEVRHNKMSFSSCTALDNTHLRYLVDIGYVDLIQAFRNLHARLHRLGVKVFIHFLP